MLSFIIFLIGSASVYGQDEDSQVRVSDLGVVIDNYGNPIPNVKVQTKGNDLVVTSNELGQFELNAKVGEVIILSHLNFYEKEVKVTTNQKGNNGATFQMAEKYLEKPEQLDLLYSVTDKNEYLGAASTI